MQHNSPLQVGGNWRGVLMLRCLTVITTASGFACLPLCPLISYEHATFTHQSNFFFLILVFWSNKSRVSSRFLVLKRGNERTEWKTWLSEHFLATQTKKETQEITIGFRRKSRNPVLRMVVFLHDNFREGSLREKVCHSLTEVSWKLLPRKLRVSKQPAAPWKATSKSLKLSEAAKQEGASENWGVKSVPVFVPRSFRTKGTISLSCVYRTRRIKQQDHTIHSRGLGLGARLQCSPLPRPHSAQKSPAQSPPPRKVSLWVFIPAAWAAGALLREKRTARWLHCPSCAGFCFCTHKRC